jgi:hypothetical protein
MTSWNITDNHAYADTSHTRYAVLPWWCYDVLVHVSNWSEELILHSESYHIRSNGYNTAFVSNTSILSINMFSRSCYNYS